MLGYALQMFMAYGLIVTHSFGADPEAHMSVPEIIAYNGYPVEEHFVQTKDGYILGIHRIPYGRNDKGLNESRPVAYLQHGLLCSSADWIVNLRNESLGFLLADAGFDVWLGNSRGNTYSRNHVSLKVDSDEFWRFSWDQMASFDLPAILGYIKQNTNQEQLYYVGHSQGTMIAFAEFSSNQELAKSVRKFFALGPVTYLGNMKSPLKYLADLVPELKLLFKILGVRDFMPQSWLIKWFASHICTLSFGEKVCANIIFSLCGYDVPQMNETRLDVYTTHSPAGTSVQNMIHYAQAYKSKKFMKYDYGETENMDVYHQATPPEYNLKNFNVETILYSGGNDWLADPDDVTRLIATLAPKNVLKNKQIDAWMHLDFIWGMDATSLIYKDIIHAMMTDWRELKSSKSK
ncbi:lysosomal acid lipase/cholesteryl ester hydrolase-like isoform X2 [Rhopilema esculentum]|uniref:lysosomal acid lipase/cholesteryl ester hydrolase-like isoform X2 n=1 Tax=Rhopilema esculentum TaxID=499914 RepID=UPI0031D59195|eukprot:gene5238-384_t